MLVYLDTAIIVYFVEQTPIYGPRATAHIARLRASRTTFAITDLCALECLVIPFRRRDAKVIGDFQAFFTATDVIKLPISTAVYERATQIRADFNYKLPDVLHLAAAVEGRCNRFLTNDLR